MGTAGILARIMDKKFQALKASFSKQRERVDKNCPLDIRLGKGIQFDQTPFILGEGKLRISYPEGESIVKAIGQYELDGIRHYKFYLEGPGDKTYFLSVSSDGKGTDEARLFQVEAEIFPGSEDEWAEWLDEQDGCIGLIDMKTPDETEYGRVFQGNGPRRIAPIEYGEQMTDDPLVAPVPAVNHEFMLYSRAVEVGVAQAALAEYLLAELIEDEAGEDAEVMISVGLGIDPNSITVL